MFTDAIFNSDIRAIQQIINRIDGGLPKDTEVANYQTSFGDCINQILEMTDMDDMKLKPDDTVMMAMSKELYLMSIKNIYWNEKDGIPRKPTAEAKKERDAAMRMILERAGGRKTKIEEQKMIEEVGVQDWICNALPE